MRDRVPLGDLGQWGSGGTPATGNSAYYGGNIPWLKIGDLTDGWVESAESSITEAGVGNSSAKLVPPNTLMVAMYGSIGKLGINRMKCATNQAIAHCVVNPERADPWFLLHQLRYLRPQLMNLGQGGGQQNISQRILKSVEVWVPALDVQRRIVSKLDALLAQSRAAREQLEAVPALVEKYRQSVLAAAFRGDLTADWRKKNPDVEPASKLLERIRAERRRRWEEAELAKMKAKGKAPKDDTWKAKYEEPERPDLREVPDLPRGWCWAAAEELTEPGRPILYGIVKPGPDTPGGVPYVRVMEMKTGSIDVRVLNRCAPERAALFKRATLKTGDILVSKDGTIGKVALVPPELEGGNITQHVLRFSVSAEVDRSFVARAVEAPFAQSWMTGNVRGVALQGVNVEDFRRMPVPLAPVEEQRLISAGIGAQLRSQMVLAGVSAVASEKCVALDRALLAKAFRGELTT